MGCRSHTYGTPTGSRLIVIWFGDEPVGTSFLAMIENACRDVSWEKYAKGYSF